MIGRGQLAKAAAWQLLFAARGASAETVRKAAEDGLMILKGFARRRPAPPRPGRDGAGPEAARLPGGARARRAPPRAAASRSTSSPRRCRRSSRSSRTSSASTAPSARPARSPTASTPGARSAPATARARLRRSASSRTSTASTSPSRPPTPTATPTCRSSKRSGTRSPSIPTASYGGSRRERGWPVLTFAELAYPSVRRLRPALLGIPLVLGAGAAVWAARRRAAA